METKLYASLTEFAKEQNLSNGYVCNMKNAMKNSGNWQGYSFKRL